MYNTCTYPHAHTSSKLGQSSWTSSKGIILNRQHQFPAKSRQQLGQMLTWLDVGIKYTVQPEYNGHSIST